MNATPMPPKKPRKKVADPNKQRLSDLEYNMLKQAKDGVRYLCEALDQDDPQDVGENKTVELLEVINSNMQIIIEQNRRLLNALGVSNDGSTG